MKKIISNVKKNNTLKTLKYFDECFTTSDVKFEISRTFEVFDYLYTSYLSAKYSIELEKLKTK